MRAKKIAATTFLTLAATTVTAATAYGEPAPDAVFSGTDRGVSYTAGLSSDSTGVSTTVQDGAFRLSDDLSTVTVTDRDGDILARLPMTVQAQGQQVRLDPQIDSAGTTLTLRPADNAGAAVSDPAAFRESVARIQDVSRSSDGVVKDVVLLGCVPGLVVGGLIGGIIGAVVGALLLIVGAVVAVPLAVLLGATLGCLIA
ncbi:hypothetical protein [Nocardia brasiliensis]|uniref:hypothetical protein n=1 Tax=Nocardia brasiliensis TaxID=37326 RepID=UPI003D8D2F61